MSPNGIITISHKQPIEPTHWDKQFDFSRKIFCCSRQILTNFNFNVIRKFCTEIYGELRKCFVFDKRFQLWFDIYLNRIVVVVWKQLRWRSMSEVSNTECCRAEQCLILFVPEIMILSMWDHHKQLKLIWKMHLYKWLMKELFVSFVCLHWNRLDRLYPKCGKRFDRRDLNKWISLYLPKILPWNS